MLGFSPDNAFLAVDLVMDLAFDVAIRSHYYYAHTPRRDDETNTLYFLKLDVVLDGIAVRLAPPPRRDRAAPGGS